jgi:hypothetical protein
MMMLLWGENIGRGERGTGVVIRDDDTTMKLTNCNIKDMKAPHDGDLNSCHAICVMGGNSTVTDTTVVGAQTCLHVAKGKAVVEDCKFTGSVYSSVKVCCFGLSVRSFWQNDSAASLRLSGLGYLATHQTNE